MRAKMGPCSILPYDLVQLTRCRFLFVVVASCYMPTPRYRATAYMKKINKII